MTLRTTRAATLALLILPALASFAAAGPVMDEDADASSKPSEGRYSMSPVDGGVMRLDKQTGIVAICARIGNEIACRGIEDKTDVPKADELSALKEENRQLKRRIKAMMAAIDTNEKMMMSPDGYGMHPGMHEFGPQAGPPVSRFEMPSEEDVDHALDYMTRIYKKIRDRANDLDKSSPPAKTANAPSAAPPIGPGSPPPSPAPAPTPKATP
ncbi:hypothetical protein [Hyphomicrobium sp. ghe19]|uniref:hypothetical protein n=1 Tax=Hyphomicrobium sp. ghe19 TaxID=2682968 RepID=UPI0013670671|nr:hypothetical protein HYPP_00654 [Hyphomicrobium sp. ghe19]